MTQAEYAREYNKEVYKTVKVYIPKAEYPAIEAHFKAQGYSALSGYIKALISADMERTEPTKETDTER